MNIPSQAGASPRIAYIIDDDATVRCSTSFMLASAGYLSRPFVSGTDFLDEADALPAGCTLLDLRMPQLDGLAFLERLPQDLRSRFPIVVVTGHGDLSTAVRAMKLGARDFIEKPFEDGVLLDILATLSADLEDVVAQQAVRDRSRNLIARLSPRERQMLEALMAGEPTKRAAHLLGISVRTAEMHRARMLERLGVRTRADAMRIGLAAGLPVE
jgi:two-component system, LuxR family, response regulator FixJ